MVITSNRTREIHDALKRRCLYHWVGYPNAERELAIVRAKVPGVGKVLSEQVVHFVQALRKEDLFKSPGVAETLDWAAALAELDVVALDPATVSDTLGVLLKYQDDIARIEGTKAKELLDSVRAELRAAECTDSPLPKAGMITKSSSQSLLPGRGGVGVGRGQKAGLRSVLYVRNSELTLYGFATGGPSGHRPSPPGQGNRFWKILETSGPWRPGYLELFPFESGLFPIHCVCPGATARAPAGGRIT